MTDNEIIKALECCGKDKHCGDCPYFETVDISECLKVAMTNARELINRQKAEIERLQKAGEEAVSCFTRMESLYKIKCKELEVAKSEAIKEFAERFNSLLANFDDYDTLHIYEIKDRLDSVKEMVGDDNA